MLNPRIPGREHARVGTQSWFVSLGAGILSSDRIHPNAAGYDVMANFVLTHLQIATANNRPADTDAEGIYDFAEAQFGTNALIAGTDGDSVLDGEEVFTHGSNPLSTDTDGDGLSDDLEIKVLGSNPNSPVPSAPTALQIEAIGAPT